MNYVRCFDLQWKIKLIAAENLLVHLIFPDSRHPPPDFRLNGKDDDHHQTTGAKAVECTRNSSIQMMLNYVPVFDFNQRLTCEMPIDCIKWICWHWIRTATQSSFASTSPFG